MGASGRSGPSFPRDSREGFGDSSSHQVRLEVRVTRALDAQRGNVVVIVQKVSAAELAVGFMPLRNDEYYKAVRDVRATFGKTGETRFIELHQ